MVHNCCAKKNYSENYYRVRKVKRNICVFGIVACPESPLGTIENGLQIKYQPLRKASKEGLEAVSPSLVWCKKYPLYPSSKNVIRM